MKDMKLDISKTPKKGQIGIVDKTFITDSEEGKRIAKVRIREERIPNIGDKMASRAGQKGTIGLVIPEQDMPFTREGIRPDIIINPHAIPSRMTIGQLVECITGKACAQFGAFGDCTAFNNEGSKIGIFGEMLTKVGFHSSGNEILYNGTTGEQISTEIFMGPTYYMRLKHMVKDKINYRPLGPRTALTRQPVSGRANDGGLRIGEMERDVLISHGISDFLKESMMERGDKYKIAICNVTGMIAIYNPAKNLFISPMADGPIQFTGSLDGKTMNIENITRFGREFSIVEVPYTLKLLIQELQTMNIQLRIITEENIEQLENMTFSKNIDKLMFSKDADIQKIINDIKFKVKVMEQFRPEKPPGSCEQVAESPVQSPEYADTSPAYVPSLKSPLSRESTDSSQYNPFTPPSENRFYPHSPDEPPPGGFQPSSPDFPPPSSPDEPPPNFFQPHSPDEPPPPVFSGGEKVHYRGDKRPERLWTIQNLGDEFITIGTEDNHDLTPDERIKVVELGDIYKEGDFSFVPNFGRTNLQETPFYNNMATSPISGMMPGGINFAPVIRINNGGTEYGNDSENEPKVSFDNPDGPIKIPTIEPEKSIVFKKDIQGTASPNQVPQQQNGGDDGGILSSMKNFIIKKLG
jgi:hypothetical protein